MYFFFFLSSIVYLSVYLVEYGFMQYRILIHMIHFANLCFQRDPFLNQWVAFSLNLTRFVYPWKEINSVRGQQGATRRVKLYNATRLDILSRLKPQLDITSTIDFQSTFYLIENNITIITE